MLVPTIMAKLSTVMQIAQCDDLREVFALMSVATDDAARLLEDEFQDDPSALIMLREALTGNAETRLTDANLNHFEKNS